jgi:hypothetical protein
MFVELGWLMRSLAAELAAGIVFAVGAYIFRSKIRAYIKRSLNFVFDTKVQVELSRVDRYPARPDIEVDMGLFQELKSELGDADFESLSENKLSLTVPGIPVPIVVEIVEPAIGMPSVRDERFEVRVKTENRMTFGYRSDECLREFERVSEDISNYLSSKIGSQPNTAFVTGTVHAQAPMSEEQIRDENLGMRAKVRDTSLEIRFDDPRTLTQGIRKYFRPIS